MKKVIILLSVLYFNSFAQIMMEKNTVNDDSQTFQIIVKSKPPEQIIRNKKNYFYYPDCNVEEEGKPLLPFKTIFLAIPPNSKAKLEIQNQKYATYENVEPISGKKLTLIDERIEYEDTEPDAKYFLNDLFPANEIEIAGYTWMRNYYCAIVNIYTHRFNWKAREITELLSANLEVRFENTSAYSTVNDIQNDIDKSLSEIIFNYKDAQNFKSIPPQYSLSDTTGNWIDYNNEYVKLGIPTDGVYRITYDALISYGVSPISINPKTLKIFSKGNELPIRVFGEEDLTFDTTDYIEFYATRNYDSLGYRQIVSIGEEYNNFLNRYTDTSSVFLTWGTTNGLRIPLFDGSLLSSSDTINSHTAFIHLEKDIRLWYYDNVQTRINLPQWQENKVWTWLTVGKNGTSTTNFSASNIVPGSLFKSYVRMISYASNISSNAHTIGVGFNSNSVLDSISFNFKETVNLFSTHPTQLLNEGTNQFKVFGRNTSAAFYTVLIDWLEIEYPRFNFLSDDSLFLRIQDSVQQGIKCVEIFNATGNPSEYLIYKLGRNAKFISSFTLINNTITFYDSIKGGDTYILIKTNKIKAPNFFYKKQFTNLRNPNRGADYIIISNSLLTQSVTQYQQFIDANYDLRTELVYVDDIYDEFGYGNPEAESIQRFLKKAFDSWVAPAPSYVLILGDANYDYKNVITNTAIRRKNLVPAYGQPVSDSWYVMWDSVNTVFQQMNVGRIPASSDDEVFHYLAKHQSYINRGYDDWNKRYILFSGGDPNNLSELMEIRNKHQNLFNNFILSPPTGGTGRHFYKTVNPNTNFGPYTPQEISNTIDSGGVFISYIGHSGTQTWDNGITSVQDIKNIFGNRKPLITDFGCSTGRFAEPDIDCFGEMFIAGDNNGQAITYAGNSSFGYLSTSLRFPEYFYSSLLNDTLKNVGSIHSFAKLKQINLTGLSEVNKVFSYCNILFGDPILVLAVPPKPNLYLDGNSISFSTNTANDQNDSLKVFIKIRNLGKTISDSFYVYCEAKLNDSLFFALNIREVVPLFEKEIVVSIPIKGRAGEHALKIALDQQDEIDEIYENDNSIIANYTVFSTSVLALEKEIFYSPRKDSAILLNPFSRIDSLPQQGIIELSDNPNFSNSIFLTPNFDTLYTKYRLPVNSNISRYYWRAKVNNVFLQWSETFSFSTNNNNLDWFIDSTFRTEDIVRNNVIFNDSAKSWELGKEINTLRIKSAGSTAGSFATFDYNLVQLVPNTFFWGIVTALIDTVTLLPYNFKYFVYPNPPAGDSLKAYIDSLPTGTVLALSVCDDAAQSVLGFGGGTPVRRAIETLGSLYIDSVRYRESWCLIGKKGAAVGTVPEAYKKQFQGVAEIDTNIQSISTNGSITFPKMSNSTSWKTVVKEVDLPTGSNIEIFPIGIMSDGNPDTLANLVFVSDTASIANIDAVIYPSIKLSANLTLSSDYKSPSIKTLGVKYDGKPELAINYQTIYIDKDSVDFNDSIKLTFSFANVGEVDAVNFKTLISIIRPDNSERILVDTLINQLAAFSFFSSTYTYLNDSSDGSGDLLFKIAIDSEDSVNEYFELNNIYKIPFYAKQDTNVTIIRLANVRVLFDDQNIVDGDFIPQSPIIKAILEYGTRFPIADTSAVKFFLDNVPVYHSQLEINHDTANRRVSYTYNPTLNDGLHLFSVAGENLIGNLESSSGYLISFQVSSSLNFVDAYNYPNPFSDKTYFTFRLPQIPDELTIRVFTVAGRIIKEIKIDVSTLKNEFNAIEWDGRDQDGDKIANGVYIYKAIMKKNDQTSVFQNKVVIVR